tara:strand:+ start:6675 stop:7133 length:459 start_codon:yes stop_codon:yes gene_type:complete
VPNVYGGERGEITHRERSQQIVSWSGIRYGRITPSDIDGVTYGGTCFSPRGVIEYKARRWVFFEFKLKGAPILQKGQLRAFEELCLNLSSPSLFLMCEHEIYDPKKDIVAAETIVTSYFTTKWREPKSIITAKEASDAFINKQPLEPCNQPK